LYRIFKKRALIIVRLDQRTNMEGDTHLPPPHPPPFLSQQDLHTLITQGHFPVNLPPALQASLTSLSTLASTFFTLPEDVKLTTYPSSHHTESGYYDVDGEKQYVTFRRIRNAAKPSQLDRSVTDMWKLTAMLLERVLCDISTALGIPWEAWLPLLDGCLEVPVGEVDSKLPTLLRVFKYLPHQGKAGVHTDNGLLTLCDGRDKGLQVWVPDAENEPGRWKDAHGPTILIGDTLRILSWGRAKAGRHRVVENAHGRSSVVFALRASLRAEEIDLSPFGDVGNRVSPEALYKFMNSRKHNVNQKAIAKGTKVEEEVEAKVEAGTG
jgi:hypothetical protein